MAVNRFKVALNSARFPLVSTKGQRAVFVPGLDSATRTPKSFMGDELSADYNIAQIIYGENFMPVVEGVCSVGYEQLIAPTINNDFDQIFALRDAEENTVLYSPSHGRNYVYDTSVNQWSVTVFADIFPTAFDTTSTETPETARVTYAYVDGKTFVCYARLKRLGVVTPEIPTPDPLDASLMFWDSATQTLTPADTLVTNLPFDVGTIDGISYSSGYLLVWSDITIAWAPFNGTAFDFAAYTNGAFTGAGNQIPEDVQGKIRAVVGLPGGFTMFTTKNCIAASYYSQNIASPWVFKEVANAGGVDSYEQTTVEGSLGALYAYTTTGIQKISLNSSEEVFPDVSDFIAGRYLERYSFGTHTARQAGTVLDFYTKIANIANRYIVISYGTYPGTYSFALVYDISLRRWGKLRMVHRDCFYYTYGAETASMTYSMLGDVTYTTADGTTYAAMEQAGAALVAAQHSLAFLKASGEVVIANWSNQNRASEDEAVVVIGRIQLSRQSNVQFNRAEIEGLASGRVYIQASHNGKDLAEPELLTDIETGPNYRVVGGMVDCKNFNLVIEGTFDLSTQIIEAMTTGKI